MKASGRVGLCVLSLLLAGEGKAGSESKPDVLCQYQMNEPQGTIEVVLLAK